VNSKQYFNQGDITVGISELVTIEVELLSAIKDGRCFTGHLLLRCYQDLQNGDAFLDRSEHMVLCGPARIPFAIRSAESTDSANERAAFTGRYTATFWVMFRYEGVHKIKPLIETTSATELLSEDEIFVPVISFNVNSK
jgi:hypothetical protein